MSDNYQEIGYYKFSESEKDNWISIDDVSIFKTEMSSIDSKSKKEKEKYDEKLLPNDKTEKLIDINEKESSYDPPNAFKQENINVNPTTATKPNQVHQVKQVNQCQPQNKPLSNINISKFKQIK